MFHSGIFPFNQPNFLTKSQSKKMILTRVRELPCFSQTNYIYKFRKIATYHVYTVEAMQVPIRLEPTAKAVSIFNYRSNNNLAPKGGDKK